MEENVKVIKLGFVNAFLLKAGDGFVLVDTGVPGTLEKLEAELLAAGALPGRLKLVVATHGDFDHIGACAFLQKKYKIKIAMHRGDLYMALIGTRPKRKTVTVWGKLVMLRARMKRIIKGGRSFDKFNPDLLLADGQSLAEYGLDAKIVHIPGHTKGSIGLLTSDGSFFAGDTFVNGGKPAIIIENKKELAGSISRIKNLPLKVIYPGHGDPFTPDLLP